MNTQIQKWGNSQGIRLPKHILDAVKWQPDEQITIEAKEGKVILQKAVAERKNIKELFADYDGKYEKPDIDWGDSVGKEIW